MRNMKRRTLYGFLLVIMACLLSYLYVKYEASIHELISGKIEELKEYRDRKRMHHDDDMIARIGIINTPCDWNKYKVIAHGGGGINGATLSNSLEGLNLAYENGTRLFDVDINYTSDSTMVLRHSWKDNTGQTDEPHFLSNDSKHKELGCYYCSLTFGENVLDSIKFVNHKVYNLYTPLTLIDFLGWMTEHPEAVMMPDFKGDIPSQLDWLLNVIERYDSLSTNRIKSRLVVRIREFSEFGEVVKLLNKEQIMLRKYDTRGTSYGKILDFCVKNGIHAVALTQKKADDEIIAEFENRNVRVYVGVVDYMSDYKYFVDKGATGIVSNFIFENQLN